MNRPVRIVENDEVVGAFRHRPVMLDEVVAMFATVPSGVIIDATVGGAGHSAALLAARPDVKILGIDQDDVAVVAATEHLSSFAERAAVLRIRFDEMAGAASTAFPGIPVVGVLFDLGVSSVQVDRAERGFSYRQDGPLDMRMDRRGSVTAADLVNAYEPAALTTVLRDGGEDKYAARIARAIVAARPLATTNELAEVVRNAIPAPARRRPGDPAKRTFQAIRLEVNRELEVLTSALDVAVDLVVPGGRVVTLAYHSGEDRLIKQRFLLAATGGCDCPVGLPCACGAVVTGRLVTRGSRKPRPEELNANRRSESARLRAIEILRPEPNKLSRTEAVQ